MVRFALHRKMLVRAHEAAVLASGGGAQAAVEPGEHEALVKRVGEGGPRDHLGLAHEGAAGVAAFLLDAEGAAAAESK